MAKVHRMYRRQWWVPLFKRKGWMQDSENGTFGRMPVEVKPQERYVLPFLRSHSDGIPLHVPPPPPLPVWKSNYNQRSSDRRAEEPGIPANVDILQWYEAYLMRDTVRQEKQAKVQTGEGKHDYYRDIAIALYRASGYSIEESVSKAYSPQGDELIRYLADDKRHKLNRTSEGGETEDAEGELISAVL